jgi:hypothetical protein
MSRSQATTVSIPGPANLDDDSLAQRERRRVHLRDRCGRERCPVKACEHVVDLGAQLQAQYLLDLWPVDLWSVVLQAVQLLDELGGEQVTAGCEYLSQLDERDAVLERGSQRAGELEPAVAGRELGATRAAQVGKHAAAHEDPRDLRIAPDTSRSLAHRSDQVQRSGQRSARHEHLGDHEHQHSDEQRDRGPEHHEPKTRQDRRVVLDRRPAARAKDRAARLERWRLILPD